MKTEKISIIIFIFISFLFVLFLGVSEINNIAPSKGLEEDGTFTVSNKIFAENSEFLFDDTWKYQNGLSEFNEVVNEQSYTLVHNRIDLSKDLTIFIKIKDYNDTKYTITFKDFSSRYQVYKNEELLYEQDNKPSSLRNIEIFNAEALDEYYIIIKIPRTTDNKTFTTLNKFLFTSYEFKNVRNNNFQIFYSILIGVIILNAILILIMFIAKRFESYTIPLLIANIITIFGISITNLGVFRNSLNYNDYNVLMVVFQMTVIFINTLIYYLIFHNKEKERISLSVILFSCLLLFMLIIIYSETKLNLIGIIELLQIVYIIYSSFYLYFFKKNNFALGFLIVISFFFVFSLFELIVSFNFNIKSNIYINNFFIGEFIFLLVFIFYTFFTQLNKINNADKIIKNNNNSNLVFQSKLNESTKTLVTQNEELNDAYNKLMSSQENKQNLMLNISHDLRTPISIIDGYIQIFSDLKLSEEEKQKYLSRIDAKLIYLKKLIGDLFLLAKIEEGNFKLIEETVEITSFTNNLIGDYKFLAENKKLEYITNLEEGNLMKNIDVIQYPRIIENIITNAIKYTESGGSVKVTTSINNNNFLLIVEDTGIGIDEKDLPKLFGSYYLQKRKSNRNDSSGIGLYITKQLVDRHQARLWVESKKGKGTKVFFEI